MEKNMAERERGGEGERRRIGVEVVDVTSWLLAGQNNQFSRGPHYLFRRGIGKSG